MAMRNKGGLAAFVLAAVMGLVAGACSDGRDALTIYSGREESLVEPLLERFAEESGIPIDVRYGDSADLALLIEEEGDDTPADVFFSQSPGSVGFLDELGMLASLDRAVLDTVPAGFRAGDGRWVGITARQRVLVYNTEMVDETALPDSVFDLSGGRWAGRVGLAPANASFQDFVTAMRQVAGEEETRRWLEDMAASDNPTYPDNLSIVDAVGRGEIPMGLVNHYYNYQYLAGAPDSPTRNYVFPDGDIGSLLIATTASVLEPSQDRERAAEFVEFLLSEDAQRYFSEETFEYPLVSEVAPSEKLPPLDTLEAPDFDIDRLGGGLRHTVRLISESGLL
jgi:iron(III) transport system substrate-binding protein